MGRLHGATGRMLSAVATGDQLPDRVAPCSQSGYTGRRDQATHLVQRSQATHWLLTPLQRM